jgi:uncharacterized protein (TIGR02145 family)
LYKWVKIGKQKWMAENLNTTRYATGDSVKSHDRVPAVNFWGMMYSAYGALNGGVSYSNPSGVLGVCPAGWHMASSAEYLQLWETLDLGFAKGESAVRMKIEDGNYWPFWRSDTYGNNLSGFSAYPSGYGVHKFSNIGLGPILIFEGSAYYWTSEPFANVELKRQPYVAVLQYNWHTFQIRYESDLYFLPVRSICNN